jgi:LysR family pca operon transcriptional activator
VETIDVSFGRSFVRQSDAIWCVPLGAVAQDLEEGQLFRLKMDTAVTAGPVGLTLRADVRPPAELVELVEAIRRCATAGPLRAVERGSKRLRQ